MIVFHAEHADRQRLAEAGLDSFEALMHREVGQLVKRKAGREVRRLAIGGLPCYLKLSVGADRVLAPLLRGRLPHVSCIRELLAIRALERAGLPVMRPIAWGERRCCGLRRAGFLLVEEVVGREVLAWYNAADRPARIHIAGMLGELQGRLHAAGFCQGLRLRDLIARDDRGLVLIDRESTRASPRALRARRRIADLARCYCKNRALAAAPVGAAETSAFLAAYARVMPAPDEAELFERVAAEVRRLSAPGAKYHRPP